MCFMPRAFPASSHCSLALWRCRSIVVGLGSSSSSFSSACSPAFPSAFLGSLLLASIAAMWVASSWSCSDRALFILALASLACACLVCSRSSSRLPLPYALGSGSSRKCAATAILTLHFSIAAACARTSSASATVCLWCCAIVAMLGMSASSACSGVSLAPGRSFLSSFLTTFVAMSVASIAAFSSVIALASRCFVSFVLGGGSAWAFPISSALCSVTMRVCSMQLSSSSAVFKCPCCFALRASI